MENKKEYNHNEEITNAILHGVGLGLAIAALVILIIFADRSDNLLYMTSFIIYGSTLVILYLASTLYHSFPEGKVKDIFQILDHSSIYLLIAGTYTPITLITLSGKLGWTIFAIVWGIALFGIILEVAFSKRYKLLSTLLYVVMGWLIIFAIKPLLLMMNETSIVFLVIGGALYTVGAIFYLWRKLKYNHAIWHLFVLAGSICHFFTILFLEFN
ncbi:channel protein, hemolysin III family [Halobacteroides halobius DSM 5150]|uniref:Channel protein, hemolysin III family n=1 Tax=Halobacteroides halobius (strain ATCC 35273 / DSM 5150 / MD-1) TaxID=748449 RepID=L0K6Z7_HALHC|nr:hemolysin III family protein [Halobacteroides halobius]AGB40295.1 channel protein, hemolysin III family [Halobacteroides halobius DSM 5150]